MRRPADFQLTYAAKAWAEERTAWRTVVQLNLVRNIVTVLDILNQEMSIVTDDDADSDLEEPETPSTTPSQALPVPAPSATPLIFNERHRLLRLKLAPLRSLQGDLRARLGACDWPAVKGVEAKSRTHDFFVRSNAGWKSALRPGALRAADKGRKKQEDSETAEVLASCAEDIKALWADDIIQDMLRRRKLRLDLLPGL